MTIDYLLNSFLHLARLTNFAIIYFLSLDKFQLLLLPGKLTPLQNQKLKQDKSTGTPFRLHKFQIILVLIDRKKSVTYTGLLEKYALQGNRYLVL